MESTTCEALLKNKSLPADVLITFLWRKEELLQIGAIENPKTPLSSIQKLEGKELPPRVQEAFRRRLRNEITL